MSLAESGDFTRILFCTDFSENADRAFGIAADVARRNSGAILFLLHVIPEPEAQFWKTYIYEVDQVDFKARRDIDAKIETAYLSRAPENLDLRVEIRVGNPAQQILDFAREREIELIVLGRRGHGRRLGTMFFGNVAGKIAAHAECPILIVPFGFRH